MDQLGRGRGRGAGQVALFQQQDRQASTGGIPRDAAPVDPAADDPEVEDPAQAFSSGGGSMIVPE
jgi:hypothetical protein